MVRVGIVGGAGYTGGELIRIVHHHPGAQIAFIHSRSNAGTPVDEVHRDLLGDVDLIFTDTVEEEVDVIFLCLGHGHSREFLEDHPMPDPVKIIDLSQDFRLGFSGDRPFVYGSPELHREAVRSARNIANPGCFATGIQLGLLPLAEEQLIHGEVQVSAITGSTGAGHNPRPTTHFSWRSNNISVYKAFSHQHLAEITQSLRQLQPDFDHDINFLPFRGNFTRGIFSTLHLKCEIQEEEAIVLFQEYYATHPFVYIAGHQPDLKQVVNTNKCILFLEKHGDNLLIISILDNLVKGASGQAVQNMNLLFDLDETAGLHLKPSAF
ncbi:MAG TPA: N-acetyl-gamma-glutamyl-phosphate reductase [bacterium]|nr:N-acetyl-gamma-glutamyl-phosphate reductase [bacterium]